ncbi:M56 family metallopeptidase [Stackebrandtia nassauensis]|uniref:Peptidase M56 BlaR1 n=1 Tax=Stackebrandtia nassauensis (strain DSM 44728 / CIP 108903 / NRRL B-16338 / NBRC 102104 / LLR-40K-21) TaxID=446470 RepID=D3Q6E5_STANL|nr:M56 family metallopeptidase [Stackebrandtia nassauensis]ADD44188.1 peptidase M56 BlaR1 [Stackebrandtia nassauensis DSM 44728]
MPTWVSIVVLGALAIALLGPIPAILERASWPSREPRAALVLWQAVGLAGGVSVLGVAIATALAPLGDTPWDAAMTWLATVWSGDLTGGLETFHLILLGMAMAITFRLAGVMPVTIWRTWTARRRHRDLVGLVSRPWPATRPGHGHVLEHPAAAVYCLPGGVGRDAPRVVFTTGALSALDDDELAAVLAHEHAHLVERHDLVALPFFAWVTALPWFPGVRRARSSVATLLEMVADDRAATQVSPATLASALARIGTAAAGRAATPVGAIAVDGGGVLQRVRRLLCPPDRSRRWRVSAYLLAAGLIVAPFLAITTIH